MKTYEVWVSCSDSCTNIRPDRCVHATKDQAIAEQLASVYTDANHKGEVRVV